MDFKIMKKIVFGLLMTIGVLNAQNNLVFNKALNFRLVPGNGGGTPGQTATVPESKVWKIESYQRDGAGSITVAFEIQNPEYGSAISFGSYSNTPIWLQEGTVLKAPSDGIYFSVLEFNVVPTSTGTGSGSGGGGVSSEGLVFSEVINQFIPTSSVTGIGTVAGSFTVPEGKIWKIHKMDHNKISPATGDFISLNGVLYISMDGIPIYRISTISAVNTDTTANTILTPGTYELKWYPGSGGGPSYCGTVTHLVGIEYNIP